MTKRRKPDNRIDEEMLREEMLREEEIRLKVESILAEEDDDVRTARIRRLNSHERDVLNERMDEINEELDEMEDDEKYYIVSPEDEPVDDDSETEDDMLAGRCLSLAEFNRRADKLLDDIINGRV